eukprot:10255763-Lingulodinium_polyedra.AAC.1
MPLGLAAQAVMLRRLLQRCFVWWACLVVLCYLDALLRSTLLGSSSGCQDVGLVWHVGAVRFICLFCVWLCSVHVIPNHLHPVAHGHR